MKVTLSEAISSSSSLASIWLLGDSNLGRETSELKGTEIGDVRRTGSRTTRHETTPPLESEPAGALDLCPV